MDPLWDVYLSFRCVDTRDGFIRHLYSALDRNGIRTFMDESEVRGGEVISDALLSAIKNSRIYLVVLSPNYAYSTWRLQELVDILKCAKELKRSVIPVFYHIDPFVVRYQFEEFREAFEKHKTRFADKMNMLSNWRSALKEVSEFWGYIVSPTRSEADIIKNIVDYVPRISFRHLNVCEYPVGIDSRVADITRIDQMDPRYDVFLSFRGEDTRIGFISHMYSALDRSGIRTFMDDPDLRSGEVISDALLSAIKNSRIYLVVLSQNYASSTWCLDELVEIIKCVKELKRWVIPVFYRIDPSVVRHQIGNFKVAFDKHEIRFAGELQKVKDWRRTLHEVASISGHHFTEKRDEAEKLSVLIRKLAKSWTSDMETLGNEVHKLSIAHTELPTCDITILRPDVNNLRLSLMDTRYFLDRNFGKISDEVNKLHDASSGHQECGNKHSKTEADICKEVVDRILLELKPTTLEVATYPVGLDSRVTDIKSLLKKSDGQGVTVIGIYGMGGIGKTTLAKAVFNEIHPDFVGSSFLANVSKQGPESFQAQLIREALKMKIENVPNPDQGIEIIKGICKIKVLVIIDDLRSLDQYNKLVAPFADGSVIIITTREKNLLDSINADFKYPVDKLDEADSSQLFKQHAFGVEPQSEIFKGLSDEILKQAGGLPLALKIFGSNLKNRPIAEWKRFIRRLKEAPNKEIQEQLVISYNSLVDDTFKEMFLDIACFFVGKHREYVIPILGSYYGENVGPNIENLVSRCLITFDEDNCFSMHDLLGDMGRKIACHKSPKNEPEKHSRLYGWKDIRHVLKHNKGTDTIEGLVHHYDYGDYDESYKVTFGTENLKNMSKLRFLKMKDVNLTGNFKHIFKDLRWLQWSHCPLKSLPSHFRPKKIVILRLPHSKIMRWELIKDLDYLKVLDLSESDELVTTPDFNRLPCLETINLRRCKKLEKVDPTIGSLESLVSLNLKHCESLRSLPDSVYNLKALESLNIGECYNLEALPRELGNLESLINLRATSLNISKLPNSIGRLSKLVKLRLDGNKKLETLPEGICNLRSLEVLNISCCDKLDISLSNLQLPPDLKELRASCCSSMSRFLDLSNLNQLEILSLACCTNLGEIEGLEALTSIKELDLESCTSMKRSLNLSNLKQLEMLNLSHCSSLSVIEGLEKLTSIRKIYLEGCGSIMLAKTLTKTLFQTYSEFKNEIHIHLDSEATPSWINEGSSGSTRVQINVSHKFLGLLLSLECPAGVECCGSEYVYTIENTTSHLTYSNTIDIRQHTYDREESAMAVVPIEQLIKSCGGCDEYTIFHVTASCEWHKKGVKLGVHPLYKPEHKSKFKVHVEQRKRKRIQ